MIKLSTRVHGSLHVATPTDPRSTVVTAGMDAVAAAFVDARASVCNAWTDRS